MKPFVLVRKRSKVLAVFAAVILLEACAVWASGFSVARDGRYETRWRTVAPFRRIELHGSTKVTVQPGRTWKLRLEGGANRIAGLTTRVQGDALVIRSEDSSATIDVGNDPVRVLATAPAVKEVRVDGSGTAALRHLRGSGLAASIHGSGTVSADGRITRLRAWVDGSGILALGSLDVDDATVVMSGSGAASVRVSDRLGAEIHGSATVDYTGAPEVAEHISGSGRIERH